MAPRGAGAVGFNQAHPDVLPLHAFVQAMREFGYVEDQNIDIEYLFAEGRLDRSPALAEELVRLSPNVIVAAITPAAVATKALTQTIPVLGGERVARSNV